MSDIFGEGYFEFGIVEKAIGKHFTLFQEMAMKRKRSAIALVPKR